MPIGVKMVQGPMTPYRESELLKTTDMATSKMLDRREAEQGFHPRGWGNSVVRSCLCQSLAVSSPMKLQRVRDSPNPQDSPS